MFKADYHIVTSTISSNVVDMFNDCIKQLRSGEGILRIAVFWNPDGNEGYVDDKRRLLATAAERFGNNQPSISFIAQKPLDSEMVLEVIQVPCCLNTQLIFKKYHGISYAKVIKEEYCELHLSGVSAPLHLSVRQQAKQIFHTIKSILECEGMPINSIVRQWNYIERITDLDGESQRYQLFNDERTSFYEMTDWPNGFPAATGIGMMAGGIVVDCLAVSGVDQDLPLTNPLQIDAHAYTQGVLIGAEDQNRGIKTTPKFERAKYIGNTNKALVYVSGTAAIRGESSLGVGNAARQTQLTLENISHLVSTDNTVTPVSGVRCLEMLRVYIKHEEDFEEIREVCSQYNAAANVSYLLADICRDELLVEIESVFSLSVV